MKRVKIESFTDVVYLSLVAGGIGVLLGGIINQSMGIMLSGVPELLIGMIGIGYSTRYTKQRREYLKTILVALVISLPLGIIIAVVRGDSGIDKLHLILVFTLIHVLSIINVIIARARFNNCSKEESVQ